MTAWLVLHDWLNPNDTDEFANELVNLRTTKGIDYILENVCKVEPNGAIGTLVKEKIEYLKKEGYINE